jgi:hypothetical protein
MDGIAGGIVTTSIIILDGVLQLRRGCSSCRRRFCDRSALGIWRLYLLVVTDCSSRNPFDKSEKQRPAVASTVGAFQIVMTNLNYHAIVTA